MKILILLFSLLASPAIAADLTITVTYTEREAQVAVQLYDIAVKAAGMSAAEAALILTRKIETARQAAQQAAQQPDKK